MSGAEQWMFWIVAPAAVIGALGLLFARKGVHAAVAMALTMVSLGIIYLGQRAEFLGIIQVFVYAGAVMMLFLFVIMLVGVDHSESIVETLKGQRWAAILLGVGMAVALIAAVGSVQLAEPVGNQRIVERGQVIGIADLIFGRYVWVFEITSALLITAALAAMVLAHHERLRPRVTQRELAAQRIRENKFVAPLPAPGVFARHNAVDTPALLPDGTPSALSVAKSIVARDQVDDPQQWAEAEEHFVHEIEEGTHR